MGYILPINHYQYQDYHQRTNQTQRSPFALEQVFRATLENKFKQQKHKEDRKDKQEVREQLYTPEHIHIGKYPIQHSDQTNERIYSEVTGKGSIFSETV